MSIFRADGRIWRADRFDQETWSVTVGDSRVGYVSETGLQSWSDVERFIEEAGDELYGGMK